MREDNPKKFETLAWKLFGKQFNQLNKDELKKFYAEAKRKNRVENTDSYERDKSRTREHYANNKEKCRMYSKEYYEKNKEQIKKYAKEYYMEHSTHKPITEGLLFKMFGVHGIQNLTIEQKREYYRVKQKQFYERHKNEVLGRNSK